MQNKMLDKLNDEIDVVNSNMIRVDTKMKVLLKKSNTCCLMMVLVAEFIILLALILVEFLL